MIASNHILNIVTSNFNRNAVFPISYQYCPWRSFLFPIFPPFSFSFFHYAHFGYIFVGNIQIIFVATRWYHFCTKRLSLLRGVFAKSQTEKMANYGPSYGSLAENQAKVRHFSDRQFQQLMKTHEHYLSFSHYKPNFDLIKIWTWMCVIVVSVVILLIVNHDLWNALSHRHENDDVERNQLFLLYVCVLTHGKCLDCW